MRDQVAATKPALSAYDASQQGLNIETTPIPGLFNCYRNGTPRALNATPDVVFDFKSSGTYLVSNGSKTDGGIWAVIPNDTFDFVVKFSGLMAFDDYFLINSGGGLGQSFHTKDPFSDTEIKFACQQSGPATEVVQQSMTRAVVENGMLSCTDAQGQPFRLFFGDGVYRAPEGNGKLFLDMEGDGEDRWTTRFHFQTGPYALYLGELQQVATGAARLNVQSEWHTGSMFFSSTETQQHAHGVSIQPDRSQPVYGQSPALVAENPGGGLPEGLYRSYELYSVWASTMYLYQ